MADMQRSDVIARDGRRFSVECETVDVTMSGIFGHAPSLNRERAPGVRRYFIDGAEVTEETFKLEATAAELFADS